MRTHIEYNTDMKSRRLADLRSKTADLERELSDARLSLEREIEQSADSREVPPGQFHETWHGATDDGAYDDDADSLSGFDQLPDASPGDGSEDSGSHLHPSERRTKALLDYGRPSAYYSRLSRLSRLSRRHKAVIGAAAAAVLVAIVVIVLTGGGPSWPSSVATVQNEAATACQNPDVKSEPGQVDFACAKATRQILWVLALMTSGNNPRFHDTKAGRIGLEPITPAQGGEVDWSLNLHQPYNPYNPVDSLEVAARAINNIIGGATLTSANGQPAVQPGLESSRANCRRYTGSPAVTSRPGFPGLCARPVTSPAGQAALVADVYQKWVVGAPRSVAQDASVLYENANDPGNPHVQAILAQLPYLKMPG
jgi:hypothetical protein